MNLWIIVPCILLFAFVIGYLLKKKIFEQIAEGKEIRARLEKEIELARYDLKKANDLNSQLQGVNASLKQENDYWNNKLIEHQSAVNNLINNGTQSARAAVDAFVVEYRANQMAIVAKETADMRTLKAEEEAQLNEKLLPLRKEVDDYTKEREAIIEARKREMKLRDELNYHRVMLEQTSIEDIKYINSILNRLSKPEVVAKVVWEVYIQGPTKEMLNRVVGKDKKSGIYRITNIDTQECYIGQGVDVGKRLAEHIKGTLGIQSIADQKIHHAMAETGLQNWTFELLEECERDELNNREKFYISYYRSTEFGYNKTVGG